MTTRAKKGLLVMVLLAEACGFYLRAANAEGSVAEAIVELPPLLIRGNTVKRWFYGDFGGLEVLSSCELRITEGFVRRYLHAQAEFGVLVPEAFRSRQPELLILVPPSHSKLIAREMRQLMNAVSASAQSIAHLRLREEDQSITYFVVDSEATSPSRGHTESFASATGTGENAGPDYLRFTLSSEYLNDALRARTPTMLPCLVQGLADTFTAASETPRGMFSLPDRWLTADDWRGARRDPEAPRALLPLSELLRDSPPTEKNERYRILWRAQSELFVRWALFGSSRAGVEGFWKFVRSSTYQPLSEELFRSAFGLDYADARDELSDYLHTAASAATAWQADVPVIPRLWFRRAKAEEIDWLRGEWNRDVLKLVARQFPELLPQYQEQAVAELTRAVDESRRSPRAVGSLGLLRGQMGEPAEAMRLLDEARRAGAHRPAVQIELARLRLASYLEYRTGPNSRLTDLEAKELLNLLSESLTSAPPLRSAYDTARLVFQHLARAPTAEETRLLAELRAHFGW